VAVQRQFKSDSARAAADLEYGPVGPAGKGEPQPDVIGKGRMDGVVEVRINSVGRLARCDCRLPVGECRFAAGTRRRQLLPASLLEGYRPVEARDVKHLVFGLAMVMVYFVFPGCTGMG